MSPSPSVFLAAVASRTKRLRFGPLVYTLALYHPLRLAEEICMLDQMSRGRLDIGVGKGISPIENGFDSGSNRGEICIQFDGIRMLFLIDRQARRQDIRGIESRIDVEQLEETAHQQSRSDQQHERERGFRNDEQGAHAPPRGTSRRAVCAFLERVDQARVRRLRGQRSRRRQCAMRNTH